MSSRAAAASERWHITVRGIVQGVGFRPFVYGLARRCDLSGFVLNDSAGVTIEVEGAPAALTAFVQALRREPPPLARIEALSVERTTARGEAGFTILQSRPGAERTTLIAPDTATCPDCLRELFDPGDRRYRYPFINCTNCGPRFTIVLDVPYDRENTTMRGFPLCPACHQEYSDLGDRRFHAQPNACPVCGPALRLLDASGRELAVADPIAAAAAQLTAGAILAIKGLGGYHLACDALNAEAVARLRQRKHREAKPFALMVPDIEVARRLCEIDAAEAHLLASIARPIVLLQRRPDCPAAPAIAPGLRSLGLMLPYTPLHHLLLRDFAGLDPARPAALVMTSGNRSDEPIAYRDDDAAVRLAPIAEGRLIHNRDIHIRCDDSVVRVAAGGQQILRRSRGYAPEPLALAWESPLPVLACGGHLKNTVCLVKGRQAFVSQHIGDLENLETLASFRHSISHLARLFDIAPQAAAYDLHPEYLATNEALAMELPHKIAVQHHHAHIASVLAEHGLAGPVIGVAADGTGYGSDGAIWGCEILVADLQSFTRLAHLRYAPLPGGEQAVRQPWRMAAVYLMQAFGPAFFELNIPFTRRLAHSRWRPLEQMIARGLNSPPASSLGRLFDAVAALLLARDQVLYEGQAAVELESMAVAVAEPYPFALDDGSPACLDVAPLIRAIVADIARNADAAVIAGRFHRSVAELLAAACSRAREQTGLSTVALSGGVFQNRLLLEQLSARLQELGFRLYINRRVPPNDGGLSLGQAAVAVARLRAGLAGE